MVVAGLPAYYDAMNESKHPQVSESAGSARPGQANRPQRILLADDEPLLLHLNSMVLADSGFEVDVAENGLIAWGKLQRNRYDLLITDYVMPMLTGIELLTKLHEAGSTVPAILVSGTMPTAELNRRPWLQLAGRLEKPYTLVALVEAVEKILKPGNATKSADLFRKSALINNVTPPIKKPAGKPLRERTTLSHRILVVDDNAHARQLHVDLLKSYGYGTEGVTDGAAGWEALQTRDYDLIITDNTMPRMTGVEMIGKLRAARMTVPVIMATGALPTLEFTRKPWLKPDVALEKPFTDDDLLAAVKSLLGPDDGWDDQPESLVPKYL